MFDGLNAEAWFRPAYFALARKALEALVGNELAMQLRVNLSIQLPGDDSSLLPVHSDMPEWRFRYGLSIQLQVTEGSVAPTWVWALRHSK